ncbi:MAG: beta-galactosidase, partial [Pseudomonadales bacterium]|nr:beta-galactosidase [Pseudomonadales bacterium]
SCHDTTLSYSEAALAEFKLWLKNKYDCIEALNSAWGNIFWSMEYNSFAQIQLPNQCVTDPNPSHLLDFKRFSSDQVVTFNRIQAEVLRSHSNAPLIHNYMGRITDFDHYKVGADLDIASWDSYPLGFLEDRSEEGDDWKLHFSQQGDPDFQAFHHDLYRSVGRGRWWIMEQQPGPVNWAPYNPAPLPGMVRLWSWEAFAHGAEAVCYFRWRQVPFAQEQMHTGLYTADNNPAPGLVEASAVAAEIETMPDVSTASAQVALVFDYESDWAWQIQPQGASFNYFKLVFDYYRALRSLGLSIDIIPPDSASLENYKLVVIPGLMSFNTRLTAAIECFSGSVLAGPRSGSKTANFALNLQPPMPGINNKISYVESLRPSVELPLKDGGKVFNWIETTTGNDAVIERTACDRPVLIGTDKRQYLTAWADREALIRMLKKLCVAEGIAVQELAEGVRVRETKTHRFVFNYNPQTVQYKGVSLEAAAVHWELL